MASPTLSILGCGWLGFPLAQLLISKGYQVRGSTTSTEKISILRSSRIDPYQIHCDPFLKGEDVETFLESKVLFLNIPFKRDLIDPTSYKIQIGSVIDSVKKSPIEFIVFASSTAVYPDDIGEAVEDKPFPLIGERAKVLWEIEQMLLAEKSFAATILRFAGLYGADRNVGRFLSGKKDIPDPHQPVNLVHLDDCVEIVYQIIEKNIQGEVVNVCSDFHPTRKDLYTQVAIKAKLPMPLFKENSEKDHSRQYKIVSNAKLKRILDYEFKYPDPMNL